jgi:hypothetical protein
MREPATGLDAASRAELLDRADLLQTEAAEVIADLDLLALLGWTSYVEHLGSSVSGLMGWRDIDFAVRWVWPLPFCFRTWGWTEPRPPTPACCKGRRRS